MTSPEAWTNRQLRAAWAREDWPTIFREYRRAAGISQRELAELVGMDQSYVSHIERGRYRITSADVIARITEGLQVPVDLGGVVRGEEPSMWTPPPELQDRIARAHAQGRTDFRTADYIARVLAEHRRAEDDGGGLDLWQVVQSQLDTVTRLIPSATGPAADRLLVLAAEHAHWLSWVAAEHGQHGAALAWLDHGSGWALEAGSADLVSWLARVRSHYSLRRGDPVRALRTAQAAQHAPRLSPAASAIAVHAEAMAAAAVGERDRARRRADEARDLALRVPDAEARPGWLYWLDPVRAQLLAADAAYAVRDWAAAAELFRQALPDLRGYPRDHAHYAALMEDAERRT